MGENVTISIWSDSHRITMAYKNRHYSTKSLILKLNNSKTYHQILTSFTVLENIDQTTFVEHIADILRLPVRTSRQLEIMVSPPPLPFSKTGPGGMIFFIRFFYSIGRHQFFFNTLFNITR